ncbi:hypothetical protein K438DRAFT_1943056 [Mycena galopus ATCC 62051]|nr:hypothetical protein K438DRAFT_1943056 [Mycena galopus ATCC 62051]
MGRRPSGGFKVGINAESWQEERVDNVPPPESYRKKPLIDFLTHLEPASLPLLLFLDDYYKTPDVFSASSLVSLAVDSKLRKTRYLNVIRSRLLAFAFSPSQRGVLTARTTASGRNAFAPRAGEQPIVYLNGFSDPFVIASLLSTRHQTPVAKKTLNPVYAPKDATWDFPIYASVADKLGVVELVVWDKDMLRKDYLGEAGIAVEDWFTDSRPKAWDTPGNAPTVPAPVMPITHRLRSRPADARHAILNYSPVCAPPCILPRSPRTTVHRTQPIPLPLVSSRPGTPARGTLTLRLGLVAPPPPRPTPNASPNPQAPNQAAIDFDAIYAMLVRGARKSLVSAPPVRVFSFFVSSLVFGFLSGVFLWDGVALGERELTRMEGVRFEVFPRLLLGKACATSLGQQGASDAFLLLRSFSFSLPLSVAALVCVLRCCAQSLSLLLPFRATYPLGWVDVRSTRLVSGNNARHAVAGAGHVGRQAAVHGERVRGERAVEGDSGESCEDTGWCILLYAHSLSAVQWDWREILFLFQN